MAILNGFPRTLVRSSSLFVGLGVDFLSGEVDVDVVDPEDDFSGDREVDRNDISLLYSLIFFASVMTLSLVFNLPLYSNVSKFESLSYTSTFNVSGIWAQGNSRLSAILIDIWPFFTTNLALTPLSMQLVKCESRSDDSLIPKQFLPTGGSNVKILIGKEEVKPNGKMSSRKMLNKVIR
jgi:hypothetical protein